MLLLKENEKKIFMNRHGKIIQPQQLKESAVFHEGLVTIIDEEDHYGFADEKGDIIFPPKWDYALYFDKEYACVRNVNDHYYMDHDGNLVPIHYDFPPILFTNDSLDFLKYLVVKLKAPVSSIKQEHQWKDPTTLKGL